MKILNLIPALGPWETAMVKEMSPGFVVQKELPAKTPSTLYDSGKTHGCPLVYPGQGQTQTPDPHSLPHK